MKKILVALLAFAVAGLTFAWGHGWGYGSCHYGSRMGYRNSHGHPHSGYYGGHCYGNGGYGLCHGDYYDGRQYPQTCPNGVCSYYDNANTQVEQACADCPQDE